MIKLRPYQHESAISIMDSFNQGHKKVMLNMPTGAGKTVVGLVIAREAEMRGRKACFIVPSIEIKTQVEAKADHLNINVDVLMYQNKNLSHVIHRYDLAILDECHHIAADVWHIPFKSYNGMVLGMTATPWREDGRDMQGYFDNIVKSPNIRDLTLLGFLCPLDFWSPKAGEKACPVQSYLTKCRGKRMVAFCNTIKQSKELVSLFKQNYVNAAHIDGRTSKRERDRLIRLFESGDIKILSNVNVISEGFDMPEIDGVILLRRIQSRNFYMQTVGRAMRPSEGKIFGIVHDHARLHSKFGEPEMVEYDQKKHAECPLSDDFYALPKHEGEHYQKKVNVRQCFLDSNELKEGELMRVTPAPYINMAIARLGLNFDAKSLSESLLISKYEEELIEHFAEIGA